MVFATLTDDGKKSKYKAKNNASANKAYLRCKQGLFTPQTRLLCNVNKPCLQTGKSSPFLPPQTTLFPHN